MNPLLVKLAVLIGFAAAFAAGWGASQMSLPASPGPGAMSPPPPPSEVGSSGRPGRGPRGGWLTSELQLSAEQQEKLAKIWSEAGRPDPRRQEERRRQLRRQRDEAIGALIRPEDRGKYDAIHAEYAEQSAALDREMRAGFQKAVEQTKEILSPQQREKYEILLKRFDPERRGGPGPRGPATSERR